MSNYAIQLCALLCAPLVPEIPSPPNRGATVYASSLPDWAD